MKNHPSRAILVAINTPLLLYTYYITARGELDREHEIPMFPFAPENVGVM